MSREYEFPIAKQKTLQELVESNPPTVVAAATVQAAPLYAIAERLEALVEILDRRAVATVDDRKP